MLPKGLGDLGGMMKHALTLKTSLDELKETLGNERIEASSGGGMVTVVMTGKQEIISLKIDPEIIDSEDAEMLETLVQAAVNEAIRKVQEFVKTRMTDLTGGIDIPGITS